MGTTYYTLDPQNSSPGYFNDEVNEDVLKNYVKHQIEYYFSKENLQRDFFLRRKMIRRFTHTSYDKHMEEVVKKADWAKRGIAAKPKPMLPMHPKIIEDMEEVRARRRGDEMTPLELKRKREREQLPRIGYDM